MIFPFEVSFNEVQAHLDNYTSAVVSGLTSDFLIMPQGEGFIEYAIFETGYEFLKKATTGFTTVTVAALYQAALEAPMSVLVVRAMLGLTPPEWAYVTTQQSGITVEQGFVRNLEREIRLAPQVPLRVKEGSARAIRLQALLATAYRLLEEGRPDVAAGMIHRLDKADTTSGLDSIQYISSMGVPYAMLLYERFLGRPFAGHRDSVSGLVGDVLELAVEAVLSQAGISYRKTKRAERVPGFEQAPDFIIPDEFNPQVIIEAKIAEDDGTARDKVTRIQHLSTMSMQGQPAGEPRYEVVACIGGRGFGVRRADMQKLLLATRGKVFTIQNLDRLVEYTRLREFRTK